MSDCRKPSELASLVVAAVVSLWATIVEAQTADILNSGRRILTAERMGPDERVTLDGVLDEPAWKRATPGGEFVQQDPVLGSAPTEATEVRVIFNREHLYIGVICRDSEPDRLLGNTRKRDEFLSADDRFMWTMDTFLNEQTGYFFEMNPSGLMADALMGPGGSTNREWDGIWNARVRRSEIGWTIEIDLPFRTLAFDPDAPAWGVNFQRTVRRKNEELLWTGFQRNQGLRRMSNAGLLVGLTGVTPGRGVELKPYLAATVSDGPGLAPEVGRDTSADVGGELTYNITPSLRAVATINTDFAETEVDTREVNLTRFPLFYPEKRGFFLDGATFFDFPNDAFFSRRIGLDDDGLPQRIDVGAKLTGQAGAHDVGVLYVRTGEERAALGEDFLVARARRRVLRQSYVGGIYTSRATRGQDLVSTRQTAGTDFQLVTSTFRGSRNLEGRGYFVWNSTPDGIGDSASWGGAVEYPNDVWEARASFDEVQKNHDPAVGFTPRTDYRRYNPELQYNPRPEHRWIRQLGFGADLDFYTDTNNRAVTRELELTAGRVELHSGDNIEFNMVPTYERLDEDFEISDDVVLPAGQDYSFTRYQLSAETANKRVLAVRPSLEWGGFLSGTRTERVLEVDVRPRPGVTVNLAYEWNSLDLAEGVFETRLYRLIADTQFSPFMYLVNNVQYDTVSRVLGWQSRFRWILTPGNDVFVVYTHNWIEPLDLSSRFRTLDRRAAAKAVYTKRF